MYLCDQLYFVYSVYVTAAVITIKLDERGFTESANLEGCIPRVARRFAVLEFCLRKYYFVLFFGFMF
jgi:hypothetical protein